MGNTFDKFCCNGSSTLQRGVSTDLDLGLCYQNKPARIQNTPDIRQLQREIHVPGYGTGGVNAEEGVTQDSKNPSQ